jgi:anti-sigma B factor antagonist
VTVLRSGFQLEVPTTADDELRVTLVGELDADLVPALADALVERCGERRVHLRVDAARLTFIDSAGIQLLLRVLCHVRGHGGDIAVVGATEPVRKVLDITGFATLSGAIVT